MKLFFSILVVLAIFNGVARAEEQTPSFEVGLGYGLLNEKSLLNLDLQINMPINDVFFTLVSLNSNYLITGSTKDSFAQSEFSSDWYARNEYGRLGLGLGYSELEPMDNTQKKDKSIIGKLMGAVFFDSVTLTTNYITYDNTLSNQSSSRIGVSYYLNDDHRVSLYREKFNGRKVGWLFETYFQPEKYHQLGSVGLLFRSGEDYDYAGITIRYFIDRSIPLKQRDRHY